MKAVVLLAALFFIAAIPSGAPAQSGAADTNIDEFDFSPSPRDPAQSPLGPASVTNPRFTLRVHMQSGKSRYAGSHEYKGSGGLRLEAYNKQYAFHYSCAYSFLAQDQEYAARWIIRDKKLEILLSKPGSKSVKRCRVTTEPAPL
jgi:hypothetical protein